MERREEGEGRAEEVYRSGEEVDFGKTAADYGKFRAGFPQMLFDRLKQQYGIGLEGQKVLDLGTGTGTVARSLARMGCTVVGLDPSAELLAEAKRLDDELWACSPQQPPPPPPPSYVQGKAEATGLPSRSFDVVTAGQCWHWFDSARAFREVARLLKEEREASGPLAATPRLVVCHFDWLPLEGGVAQATERLVLKHNPGWKMHGGTGFYPQWAMRAAECGFQDIETFSFVVDVPYSHEAWRGRIRAMAGVAASLAAEQVKAFDEEHGAMLQARFPEEPLHIPHRVWAMVCSPPSSSSHAE